MRDQPQAWSDRPEPVMEGVPAQRPPAEDVPAGTGPDGAWAPPPERVAPGVPGAWTPAGAPDEAPDGGQEVEDRAVGVASVPDTATDDETRADASLDEAARDVASRDDAARDDAARDEAARDDAARDDAARDEDEAADEVRAHDEAPVHDEHEHEPRLVDNGDDEPGAVYSSEVDDDSVDSDIVDDTGTPDAETAGADEAEADATATATDTDTDTDDAAHADDAVHAETGHVETAGERAARLDAAPAVDVELPEDMAPQEDAPREDALSGGVPDDAVSTDDAPVPAAAYDMPGADVSDVEAAAEAGADTAGTGGELMPGDVHQEPVSALFAPSDASDFRDRWQRVQMQFVDDPRAAADQARALVDDVSTAVHEALTNQRGTLDSWQSGQSGDTEELRVAVRRYRDFLDRMLGL